MTFDQYVAKLGAAQRAALERARGAILAAVPRAEECVSYGLPAFRLDGKLIAGLGASAKHCSYYPMSGGITAALAKDLAGFETSKGAVKFTPEKPLSVALIKKLVKARIAEEK